LVQNGRALVTDSSALGLSAKHKQRRDLVDTGLSGKAALITGGASGIGLGIAKALASEGVHLAIAGLTPDAGAIAQLRALGVRVEALDVDVSKEELVLDMVKKATSTFGGIDLYVNNAAWTWHRPVTRLDTESLMNTLRTNLFALHLGLP
jgi:NAD(P)-dependent dehydrogenase (short-subunit alcohol dehydrogenase family)